MIVAPPPSLITPPEVKIIGRLDAYKITNYTIWICDGTEITATTVPSGAKVTAVCLSECKKYVASVTLSTKE